MDCEEWGLKKKDFSGAKSMTAGSIQMKVAHVAKIARNVKNDNMNEKISQVLAQKDMLQRYIEDLKFFNEDFGDVSYVVNAKKAELRKCNYKLYAAYSFLAFMILLSYLGMLLSSYVVGYMLIGGSYLTAFGAVIYSVGFLLLIFDLVKEYD